MTKSVSLSVPRWEMLLKKLKVDYNSEPPSTLLIRDRMKEKLGFVSRYHGYWQDNGVYHQKVFLDFYDEQKKIMFLLRYSDFIKN
jgi:hypothetical protein